MLAQNKSTGGVAVASLMLVVAVVAMLALKEAEAVSLSSFSGSFACAKDYMINLLRDKIISSTELVGKYEEAMESVRQRFEEAEKSGELDGKDDKEKENFYLKLTVEEMRNMRESILSEGASDSALNLSAAEKTCIGKTDDDTYDPDAEVEGWSPDELDADEAEIEAELMNELDKLEQKAAKEAEMGWAMTPEAKLALQQQTRMVIVDLMNNEARQIALTCLTAYFTGAGSFVTMLTPLLGGLKLKLAQFLIHAITQVVSAIIGHQIDTSIMPGQVSIKPVEALATTVAPTA